MPELPGTNVPLLPQVPSRGERRTRIAMGYDLERLGPREAVRGPVFSIDTPYLATPAGWGEWIPVLPNEPLPPFVAILAPALVP